MLMRLIEILRLRPRLANDFLAFNILSLVARVRAGVLINQY
jgi:hypothetical protein